MNSNLFYLIIGICMGWLANASDCMAQTQYFYGAQGQAIGTAQTFNGTTYFYNAQGQSVASAQQFSGTTYVYGSQGQNLGTVQTFTPSAYTMPTTPSLTPIYDSIFGK